MGIASCTRAQMPLVIVTDPAVRTTLDPAAIVKRLPATTKEEFESMGFTFSLRDVLQPLPPFSRRELLHVLEFVVHRAIESENGSPQQAAALVRRYVPDVTDHEFHVIFANCLAYNFVPDSLIAEAICTSKDRLLVACLLLGNVDVTPLSALKRDFVLKNMFHQ